MKTSQEFEDIYSKHWEKLYAFSFKITKDSNLSKNIIQDVFTNLWERKNSLNINSVEHFLFRAVKNQILKHYNQNSFNTTSMDDEFDNFIMESPFVSESDLSETVFHIVDKLPAKRKEIFLMNKLQEMNVEQIAEELKLSKQTVKNQLSSAIKQLRLELKQLSWLLFPFFF